MCVHLFSVSCFLTYKAQVSSEWYSESVSFHKLSMPRPCCLWMKQGAYWVNCSRAHIHDPLHGNQSIYMSDCSADLQQSNWQRRWGLHARLRGGRTGRGRDWEVIFCMQTGQQAPFLGSILCNLALGIQGVAAKPPFMCCYPSKARGILLSNSKHFLHFVFETKFSRVGQKNKVRNDVLHVVM